LQVHDWQAIVKEHGPMVWQTAYRLLVNRSDTADCFQDAFPAAFEIAQQLQIRTNAAGVLLHRAKAKLRESLSADDGDARGSDAADNLEKEVYCGEHPRRADCR
jgi:DNA-directed RNA polymerase specialized sigma24 family protein